jgi:hypothetical protein
MTYVFIPRRASMAGGGIKKYAAVRSKYHTGTQMEHRVKSRKSREDRMTPCGVKVLRCVEKKKAECRKRSRALLAQKMGLSGKAMSEMYPNHDVHHEKRMTYTAKPGCSCTLKCPFSKTSLVPSSWNRGKMKAFETQVQRGYSFEDQMKGVRKSDGTGKAPLAPDSAMGTAQPVGSCRPRQFHNAIDIRIERRAYENYVKTTSRRSPLSRLKFGASIKEASRRGAVLHTLDELRAMKLTGAGLHDLTPRPPRGATKTKLRPIVVLRGRGGRSNILLDGKGRVRAAHSVCPARARVAVLFLSD